MGIGSIGLGADRSGAEPDARALTEVPPAGTADEADPAVAEQDLVVRVPMHMTSSEAVFVQELPALHVPELGGAVRDEQLLGARRMEREVVDRVVVAVVEQPALALLPDSPDTRAARALIAVTGEGGDEAPVAVDRYAARIGREAVEGLQQAAIAQVPQPHGVVLAARHEPAEVGVGREASDLLRVPVQL